MNPNDRRNPTSHLLRRVAGAFAAPWVFWGSAACLGCAVFLSADFLSPLWMQIKPRPTTVAQPLLNTPLAPLAPWLPIFLLYVPDMLLLFATGLFAGFWRRRLRLRWLTVCVGAYTVLNVAFGGHVWRYALVAALEVDLAHFLRYGTFCLLILSAAYVGAIVATRLRPPIREPGLCKKCGYSLYGLPSMACPECGKPFSPRDAEYDADAESQASNSPLTEHGHDAPPRTRTARRVLLLRVCMMGALLSLFYGLDWIPFRAAQRDLIAWSLGLQGYAPEAFTHEGSPALRVGDHAFSFTAECTYLDLLMIVAPFLWVFGASLRRNILRIGIAALIILGGNLIRCWASVYFNVRGIDWFYTHDLPDYVIWWPTVAVVVLLALRRDFGDPSRRRANNLRSHRAD